MIYGFISLTQVAATWLLLRRYLQTPVRLALGGALFVAVWPEFIYRSVRLMDFALEGPLLALALIAAFCLSDIRKKWAPWFTGAVLAVSFFVRYQTGLYFLAIAAAWALESATPDRFRRVFRLGIAYALGIAVLSVWEMRITGRGFLAPFLAYIHFNWVENGAVKGWGSAPWHRYFSELAKFYGFLPILILSYGASRRSANRALMWVFFLPLIVHVVIAHKEARFVFGFAWVWVPLALSGLADFRLTRRMSQAALGVCLIGLLINAERISRRLFTGAADIRQWARIGAEIQALPTPWPLHVLADPASVPGAFFLRTRGPLCYDFFDSGQLQHVGNCGFLAEKGPVLTLLKQGSEWTLHMP